MKQVLGIALALGLLQGFLVGEKGGTLGEENRNRAQANIFHRLRGIVAGAPVRKAAQDLAQMLPMLLPGFKGFDAHEVKRRRASVLRVLR